MPNTLANALDRGRSRWGDSSYLNRIIFSEMIKEEIEEETGYGISHIRCDYNYDDIVINHNDNTVLDRDGKTLSFADFIKRYKNVS